MELKAAYDACIQAQAAAQAVALEIEAQFEAGNTDEALSLREKWDAAKAKVEAIVSLYDDMVGTVNNEIAKKFVPASKTKETDAEKPKVMTRAEFDELSAKAKMEFIKADGKIVDEEA